MIRTRIVPALIGGALLCLGASPAFAQATRTWVSGVGDDANPCSRTAPCKTFAGAISKTATGGEISVLDPGGYGAVNITKAISIVADGDYGSIIAANVNGIIVNAPPPNNFVIIRGLDINGAGTTTGNGIRLLQGDLHIEDTNIHGHRGTGAGQGHGILMNPTTTARLYLRNVRIYHNNAGISILPNPAGGSALIEDSSVDRNATFALKVDGASMTAVVENSTFFGAPGVQTVNGGKVTSFGDNVIFTGAPTSTLPLQ